MTNRIPANKFNPKDTDGLLVVKLYADWCPPCKAFAPEFDKAAETHTEATFASINIDDDDRQLAKSYGVRSIPSVLFFLDGEKVKMSNDIAFQETLDNLLPEVWGKVETNAE